MKVEAHLGTVFNSDIDSDTYKLENSDEWLDNVHSYLECMDTPCTIHNRTNHSMRRFPQHWRSDRGIMERICTHGVGHPDPDDYKCNTEPYGRVHGCDGCCSK
jgi:hypothetical protein